MTAVEDQITMQLARIDLRRSVLENMLQGVATSQQQREEIEVELRHLWAARKRLTDTR